jgi:hypothetical protein
VRSAGLHHGRRGAGLVVAERFENAMGVVGDEWRVVGDDDDAVGGEKEGTLGPVRVRGYDSYLPSHRVLHRRTAGGVAADNADENVAVDQHSDSRMQSP